MSVLDRFRLDGKVAVVTGASSGLGVGFARALAEAGADLVLGARRADRLADTQAMVEGLGRKAVSLTTDVTRPEDCTALVQAGLDAFGHVDVLVNNAGLGTAYPATRETPEQFRQVLEVNLEGAYWMAQACGRVMQPGSSIVNIASVLGMMPSHLPQAAYAASKAGVIGLTRDLAQQWVTRKGIRVNALAPGYFQSEMTQSQLDDERQTATILGRTPMGRMGQTEELAAALVFLASDASSYVTGVTLPVDGGMVMP
jgi:NAD(P)-dependent dehydrogenase (short-subunit alcohol dehydrogenase family)